jgi:hypothetical protein
MCDQRLTLCLIAIFLKEGVAMDVKNLIQNKTILQSNRCGPFTIIEDLIKYNINPKQMCTIKAIEQG